MIRRLPFDAVARAALAQSERLLAQWLPDGHAVVGEWKALNPRRVDKHVGSFSVNLRTGVWCDFAGDDGDKGADLVSLYAYLFTNDDQGRAIREVGALVGVEVGGSDAPLSAAAPVALPAPEPKPEKAERRSPWVPLLPVPEDAPPPPNAHEFRGVPSRIWDYRDASGSLLGYVARFEKSTGGKEIVPLTYCEHASSGMRRWSWVSFDDPRPLYGLDRVGSDSGLLPVLVVEGEKCADAAASELPDFACVSWPGGGKAPDKADWSPLKGRKVILWPDADAQREALTKDEKASGMAPEDKPIKAADKQPGIRTMLKIAQILIALGCEVWMVEIPPPGEKPGGWDVADAIDEGLHGETLEAWIRDHAKRWPAAEKASDPAKAAQADGASADRDHWRDRLLFKKGELVPCVANVFDILAHEKAWAGVLAWDEHAMRTVKLKVPPYQGGKVGEWDSLDDSMAAMWLGRHEYLVVSSAMVCEAVESLAHMRTIHPARDWMRKLPDWDGVKRLDGWLATYAGVPVKPGETDRDKAYNGYIKRVSRWFFLGMIARTMKPGCKFDYCMVLEGRQGKGKSTTLSIIGGEWYGDTDLDLTNKDSMSALRGKMLYEFSEMGSVTRAESSKQKSFLSRQVDEYRPVYGRREIKSPRQLVFAGSVNEWEWNKDPTGGRRFWPVVCEGAMDLDALRRDREQLFAEALALYDAGARYWPTADEQRMMFDPEQLARELSDSLVDALHDWVYKQVGPFSKADAMSECLKLDPSKFTRDMDTRVGIALRKLGCTRIEKRNGMTRYLYEPPKKEAKSSVGNAAASPAQPQSAGAVFPLCMAGEDDDVSF